MLDLVATGNVCLCYRGQFFVTLFVVGCWCYFYETRMLFLFYGSILRPTKGLSMIGVSTWPIKLGCPPHFRLNNIEVDENDVWWLVLPPLRNVRQRRMKFLQGKSLRFRAVSTSIPLYTLSLLNFALILYAFIFFFNDHEIHWTMRSPQRIQSRDQEIDNYVTYL